MMAGIAHQFMLLILICSVYRTPAHSGFIVVIYCCKIYTEWYSEALPSNYRTFYIKTANFKRKVTISET